MNFFGGNGWLSWREAGWCLDLFGKVNVLKLLLACSISILPSLYRNFSRR